MENEESASLSTELLSAGVSTSETENLAEARAKVDILNFDREELAAELSQRLGFESFRSQQLIQWLYRQRLTSFEPMTNIAKSARDQLAANYQVFRPQIRTVLYSKDGSRKYLFELPDKSLIESVLIKQPTRYTLCISSQVGCAIGCTFCRTGLMGLTRNLTTAEIIGQVLAVQDQIEQARNQADTDPELMPDQFHNIVFMGMGEPLHNLDNVIRAVKLLNDELGLGFSYRKITVSTSGLVPAIEKFGVSNAGANLAISLNATTDEVRTKLIPINKKWPLAVLLEALRVYPLRKGRRITIEYVMLKGVNDTKADLRRLPKLLHGIPVKVNLIPYNANAGLGFDAPDRANVAYWQKSLLDAGLNSTIRWSKGEDIAAACGQLATQSEGSGDGSQNGKTLKGKAKAKAEILQQIMG